MSKTHAAGTLILDSREISFCYSCHPVYGLLLQHPRNNDVSYEELVLKNGEIPEAATSVTLGMWCLPRLVKKGCVQEVIFLDFLREKKRASRHMLSALVSGIETHQEMNTFPWDYREKAEVMQGASQWWDPECRDWNSLVLVYLAIRSIARDTEGKLKRMKQSFLKAVITATLKCFRGDKGLRT